MTVTENPNTHKLLSYMSVTRFYHDCPHYMAYIGADTAWWRGPIRYVPGGETGVSQSDLVPGGETGVSSTRVSSNLSHNNTCNIVSRYIVVWYIKHTSYYVILCI